MVKTMTDIKAPALLDSWANSGLVEASDRTQLEQFIISQQQEQELPLYLRIVAGIGAFIASLCFIGFLSISNIISFQSESSLIIWGLIFIATAIYAAKSVQNKSETLSHSFMIQSSFCAMGVGKILFVFGFAKLFDGNEGWGAVLATSLVTAATYYVYRMSIDRFLSTFAVFTSLFINIVGDRNLGNSAEYILNLFFFVQMVMAAVLLTHGKIKREFVPLAYATIISLCMMVIYFASTSKMGYWHHQASYNLTFMNFILTASLIGAIGWAAGGIEKLKAEPLMLASLGAILLGLVSAPGVILAIGLMILGYAKHERLLLLLGILLMPVFILNYYDNLDVSLLAKSGILIGSGAVLLAGRGYLAMRKLDREG